MADSISVSQLKPLPGYVLVEPTAAQKQTDSGIYLPESPAEKPQHGTVIAVGESVMEDGQQIKAPVKAKDKVIYKKWGGNDFKLDDVEYQFLKFEDLLAVIK